MLVKYGEKKFTALNQKKSQINEICEILHINPMKNSNNSSQKFRIQLTI